MRWCRRAEVCVEASCSEKELVERFARDIHATLASGLQQLRRRLPLTGLLSTGV